MILILLVVNFAISWFNAWVCGKSWNETKYTGGIPHFMNWMGAIMSACGFTWCYLIPLAFAGTLIPMDQDDGTTAPMLSPAALQAVLDLGYMAIIIPTLGSGLAITISAWAALWKRRTIANAGVAAWDTFAMVYNISNALEYVPKASTSLWNFFSSDDDSITDRLKGIVVILVVIAVVGGILTTRAIIKRTARNVAMDKFLAREAQVE
jgi:hypothetical protein